MGEEEPSSPGLMGENLHIILKSDVATAHVPFEPYIVSKSHGNSATEFPGFLT